MVDTVVWCRLLSAQVLQEERQPTPRTKNDAESGSSWGGPLLDSGRSRDDAQRPQVSRLHLWRADGGRGKGQMQIRPAPEQGGEEEEAESHGQVPLGPRHQREDPGGGVQRGLRGTEEITPHPTPGQETLQDRDPQTGYMLHLLSQPRVGCLRVTPPPKHHHHHTHAQARGQKCARCASFGFGKGGG